VTSELNLAQLHPVASPTTPLNKHAFCLLEDIEKKSSQKANKMKNL